MNAKNFSIIIKKNISKIDIILFCLFIVVAAVGMSPQN